MKHILPALRMFVWLTILTGVIYPLLVSGMARAFFADQAQGQLIVHDQKVIGSRLIAQKFEGQKYFWSRPSAVDYNPLPSGGSNLSQTSADLKKAADERRARLVASNPGQGEPPQELLFASASGLDPHLSPSAVRYQIDRVARARNLSRQKIEKLVEESIEARQWGFLGEPRINVLQLNLALDELKGASTE